MEISAKSRYPVAIPSLIAIIFLLGALLPWPYAYYNLLRWVVCGACVWVIIVSVEMRRTWATVVFGISALLFNPIIKVQLQRETWQIIDLVLAVVFLGSMFAIKSAAGKRYSNS